MYIEPTDGILRQQKQKNSHVVSHQTYSRRSAARIYDFVSYFVDGKGNSVNTLKNLMSMLVQWRTARKTGDLVMLVFPCIINWNLQFCLKLKILGICHKDKAQKVVSWKQKAQVRRLNSPVFGPKVGKNGNVLQHRTVFSIFSCVRKGLRVNMVRCCLGFAIIVR